MATALVHVSGKRAAAVAMEKTAKEVTGGARRGTAAAAVMARATKVLGTGAGTGPVSMAEVVVVATDQATVATERGGKVQTAEERAARDRSVENCAEPSAVQAGSVRTAVFRAAVPRVVVGSRLFQGTGGEAKSAAAMA